MCVTVEMEWCARMRFYAKHAYKSLHASQHAPPLLVSWVDDLYLKHPEPLQPGHVDGRVAFEQHQVVRKEPVCM